MHEHIVIQIKKSYKFNVLKVVAKSIAQTTENNTYNFVRYICVSVHKIHTK